MRNFISLLITFFISTSAMSEEIINFTFKKGQGLSITSTDPQFLIDPTFPKKHQPVDMMGGRNPSYDTTHQVAKESYKNARIILLKSHLTLDHFDPATNQYVIKWILNQEVGFGYFYNIDDTKADNYKKATVVFEKTNTPEIILTGYFIDREDHLDENQDIFISLKQKEIPTILLNKDLAIKISFD